MGNTQSKYPPSPPGMYPETFACEQRCSTTELLRSLYQGNQKCSLFLPHFVASCCSAPHWSLCGVGVSQNVFTYCGHMC